MRAVTPRLFAFQAMLPTIGRSPQVCGASTFTSTGGHIRDGGGAGRPFAAAQHLGEEGPENQGVGENSLFGEQAVVPGEGRLDGLAVQYVGERQAGLLQKGFGDGVVGDGGFRGDT